MVMNEPTQDCARFREDLSAWLDGDVSPEAARHLAGCDACRDLRHEARLTARTIAAAGADHVAPSPDALVANVLGALDARALPARPAPQPYATRIDSHPAPVPQVADAAQPYLAASVAPPQVFSPAQPEPRATAAPRSRARWVASGGIAFAVAAAAAVGLVALRDPKAPKEVAPVAAIPPWSARVDRVLRASADRAGGLDVMLPGANAYSSASESAALPAGSRLRTDGKTRARLRLDDGSVLVLDRATELVLDSAAPRSASLIAGNVVADVAHVASDAAAHIATPSGPVEVLGTRFSLTATADRTSVRVTRGVVKLGATAQAVEVKTGQEGLLARGEGATVAPAVDLASAMSWAELSADASDAPVVGLGELRARRPGSATERDEALHLASHTVKVRIVGNVARTEIEEVFRNDTGQALEGVYRFPLPPEGQVETLALDVGGRMEPGSFVDRDRAAAIWRGVIRHATPHPVATREEYVWVPGPWRDPALLEWQRGGRFELRVFPIPAHGTRKVSISYTQTVAPSAGVRRYVYPLPHNPDGSTRVDQFSLDVQVLGHERARGVRVAGYPLTAAPGVGAPVGADRMTFAQQGFVPSGDLLVEYALPDARAPLTAWTYQPPAASVDAPSLDRPYATFALRPTLPRWGDARPRDYVLVVDASRSMVGERITRASRLVGAAVAEMDRRDRFTVLACDTRCRAMGAMQLASDQGAASAQQFVAATPAAGASDLVAQVREAVRASAVSPDASRDVRIVYVGDGAASVGWRRPDRIAAAVRDAIPAGRMTVTAVAIGSDADAQTLGAVARGGGGALVPYVPGERVHAAALSLLEATYGVALRDPEVILPAGLSAMAPAKLGVLRAGSEAIVTAQMTAPTVVGDVVLRGTVGGEPFEARYPVNLTLSGAEGNAFVPRLYAAARIADLEAAGAPTARAEIIELSQRYRVASRYTSLLVLESPAMFRAFGVERNTAQVEWTGETSAQSTVVPGAPEAGADALDEAAATGGLGTLGARDQIGSGYGAGRAGSMGHARAPSASIDSRVGEMGDANQPMLDAPAEAQRRSRGPGAVVTGALPTTRADPRRTWGWMRRVWVRRAALAAVPPGDGADPAFAQRAERAREALLANPDSRDRHRELYRWLALAGEVDESADITARWMGRDPLDADAITRMADVAARQGDRDRSVRLLAGVLDVRPDDVAAHERMALLHERAGEAERACAYRVAIAELRPNEATAQARAVRCERALGRELAAARLVTAISDTALRARVEGEAATGITAIEGEVRGELTVTATWEGDEDLDLAVIDPRGVRLSWQGGRAGITARHATSTRGEALAVSRLATGEHLLEVARAAPSNRPVQGRVTVRALGQDRTFAFVITGERARVGRVTLLREVQLVPAEEGRVGPMIE
jgi:ferric-dicitrate binding protein FerR (iron transport regulator)